MLFSHSIFQVSLVLEPLSETCDTGSSVPAPDGRLDTSPAQGSSKPQFLAPSPQPKHTRIPAAGQEPADSSRATTPRYFFFAVTKFWLTLHFTLFLNQ